MQAGNGREKATGQVCKKQTTNTSSTQSNDSSRVNGHYELSIVQISRTVKRADGHTRVSFETSFDSKQPKLEPKPVSALSETKRLFGLFRFYTDTESFDVSIELKQTEDQSKQFDREHIFRPNL